MNDIFRFMVLRLPQLSPRHSKEYIKIELSYEFDEKLTRIASSGDQNKEDLIKEVKKYYKDNYVIKNIDNLGFPINKFVEEIKTLKENTLESVEALVTEIFKIPSSELIKTDVFIGSKKRIADSITSTMLVANANNKNINVLGNCLRCLNIIERVAEKDQSLSQEMLINTACKKPLILPSGIFPPPRIPEKTEKMIRDIFSEKEERLKVKKEEKQQLYNEYICLNTILSDLMGLNGDDFDPPEIKDQTKDSPMLSEDLMKHLGDKRVIFTNSNIPNIIRLVDQEMNALKEGVKSENDLVKREAINKKYSSLNEVFQEINKLVPDVKIDLENKTLPWKISKTTQKKISEETINYLNRFDNELNTQTRPKMIASLQKEISNVMLKMPPIFSLYKDDSDVLATEKILNQINNNESDPENLECLKKLSDSKPFNVIGWGDLHIVREQIQKYDLGEIAHIENILEGEIKIRKHIRKQIFEETDTYETEHIEETENELEKAERFEQHNETETTIQEDESLSLGVNVNASYGPFVEVNADSQYSSSQSRNESNSTASKYAQDITTRSVSRLQERVRQEAVRKRITNIEESNKHTLDNTIEPDDHVVGVYRWLDKIYKNQIFNYGKRLMFEFIVPEPGAYLLWNRASHNSIYGDKPKKPDFPTIKINQKTGEKVPLQPDLINNENYQQAIATFKLSGIEPPPDSIHVESFTLKTPNRTLDYDNLSDEYIVMDKNIQIPKGYQVKSIHGIVSHGLNVYYYDPKAIGILSFNNFIYVYIQDTKVYTNEYDTSSKFGSFKKEFDKSDKYSGSISISFQAHYQSQVLLQAEIVCEPTVNAIRKWQQSVFDAIVISYENELSEWEQKKSEYEENIRSSQIANGFEIEGHPPATNRQLEKEELKKNSLQLLTGRVREFEYLFPNFALSSVFEPFEGAPPVLNHWHANAERADLASNSPKPNEYIQFFEQAFEWDNLYYTLYPYFWSRYSKWQNLQNIDDVDPLHKEFLKAGAARVLVPIRPNYELAILHYLDTGALWSGEDAPGNIYSDFYVPLAAEIREGHGIIFHKSDGKITVEQNATTVIGSETNFVEDDVDREILIEGISYRIATVNSKERLELTTQYQGRGKNYANYAIGAKYEDAPWYVKIPTTLVMLQKQKEPKVNLPDWTDELG